MLISLIKVSPSNGIWRGGLSNSFFRRVRNLPDLFQANMACLVKPVNLPQCFIPTQNNLEALET